MTFCIVAATLFSRASEIHRLGHINWTQSNWKSDRGHEAGSASPATVDHSQHMDRRLPPRRTKRWMCVFVLSGTIWHMGSRSAMPVVRVLYLLVAACMFRYFENNQIIVVYGFCVQCVCVCVIFQTPVTHTYNFCFSFAECRPPILLHTRKTQKLI